MFKYLFFIFLCSCQLLEVEEVIERSRQARPTWVQMYEKGVWTGGEHSYIVVAFRDSGSLQQAPIKEWLKQEKQRWSTAEINGKTLKHSDVADIYYEQTQVSSGVQSQRINVIYALLKLDIR